MKKYIFEYCKNETNKIKIRSIRKKEIEYYFIETEDGHTYRRPVDGCEDDWEEWLNEKKWIRCSYPGDIEMAFIEKLNHDTKNKQ